MIAKVPWLDGPAAPPVPMSVAKFQQPVSQESVQEQAQPPVNPAAATGGMAAWESALSRLSEDKALQRALLAFGAQALQPRAPGTGSGGAIGKGVAAGVNAYDSYNQRQTESERAEREEDRADRRLDLQGRRVDIEAERAEDADRQLDLAEEKFDLERDMSEAERERIEAQAGYYNAKAAEALSPDGQTMTGETQQVADRMYRSWDPEVVERMGGESAAFDMAYKYVEAIKSGKSPQEFRQEIEETYNEAVFNDRLTKEEAEKEVRALMQSYEQRFTNPAQRKEFQGPWEQYGLGEKYKRKNPNITDEMWLQKVKDIYGPEAYDAAMERLQGE